MSLVVVDASAFTVYYLLDDPRRAQVKALLRRGDALFAPAHVDAEIHSALRGLALRNSATASLAPAALRHLAAFPLRRMALEPLLLRMWELRDQLTSYDAAYVALAERLNAPLVTCDAKMARASQAHCAWEVVT